MSCPIKWIHLIVQQPSLKQCFSLLAIRSVCDRFLLPSRSQRKSPHSSPDLCGSHWWGHWSCRRCLHSDRQEAWGHLLMSETERTKWLSVRVWLKLHIIEKNVILLMLLRSVKVKGYLYIFGIGRINVFSMINSCYFLQQSCAAALYQNGLDFFQLRHYLQNHVQIMLMLQLSIDGSKNKNMPFNVSSAVSKTFAHNI